MIRNSFTKWFFLLMLSVSVAVSSCQKDSEVKDLDEAKTAAVTSKDSVSAVNIINTPGNFLAGKGSLKVTIEDSTYIFDAVKDSIAFINVQDGDNKYFGITAINKAHNMSFGISSSGLASVKKSSDVAGSQFLFKVDEKKPLLQYTLTKYAGQQDFGKIDMEEYNHESMIAKGTFFTFLAKDDKSDSPFYRVEGSFELQLK
ncbi:hypothetical protein [Mucilaginibacter celer]|uniref:Uncharacterized protein n=1 Tax=Mucilaginibacter celer TaxID=2305508 RepID=A0A494VZK9_9SPHI|nr:hypothetical protein [Mucilaginibacter celer]AYL96402.1 hypothetical protein HYN43_014335 [Mucilaginibacter celer]